jgi:hypothetical protein
MKEINFSPFATNVLDMMDKSLEDRNGRYIIIRSIGVKFGVFADGIKVYESDSNVSVSYFLNCLGVFDPATKT